jgi:Putative addiction module component
MSERAKKVLEEARLLPVEERREVVEAILEMDVEDDTDGLVEDPAEVERAWDLEIERRMRGLVDGSIEVLSREEVRKRLARKRTLKAA